MQSEREKEQMELIPGRLRGCNGDRLMCIRYLEDLKCRKKAWSILIAFRELLAHLCSEQDRSGFHPTSLGCPNPERSSTGEFHFEWAGDERIAGVELST